MSVGSRTHVHPWAAENSPLLSVPMEKQMVRHPVRLRGRWPPVRDSRHTGASRVRAVTEALWRRRTRHSQHHAPEPSGGAETEKSAAPKNPRFVQEIYIIEENVGAIPPPPHTSRDSLCRAFPDKRAHALHVCALALVRHARTYFAHSVGPGWGLRRRMEGELGKARPPPLAVATPSATVPTSAAHRRTAHAHAHEPPAPTSAHPTARGRGEPPGGEAEVGCEEPQRQRSPARRRAPARALRDAFPWRPTGASATRRPPRPSSSPPTACGAPSRRAARAGSAP